MKNRIFKCVVLVLVFVLISIVKVPVVSDVQSLSNSTFDNSQNVINVSNDATNEIEIDEVYKARFLNMLNHNFVYGESFESVEDMINDSMPALVCFRENEDSSFIAEQFVTDYIFNMYGIDFIDYTTINSDFEQTEGYVYILPRGFSTYQHEIASVKVNEDGSFTVKTNVKISSHDSGIYNDVCETLFVKNEKSQFGFSIIRSNIGLESVSA